MVDNTADNHWTHPTGHTHRHPHHPHLPLVSHTSVSFHYDIHGPTTLSVTGVFFVAGPRVRNSLPADLRLEMQFRAFRRQLKTVLFSR